MSPRPFGPYYPLTSVKQLFTIDSMKRATMQRNTRLSALETDRTTKFGPPPDQYIKQLRESTGKSIQATADEMGITKQALIRLEQGTFEHVLPAAMEWYVTKLGVSELEVSDSYEFYQTKTRERNHRVLGDTLGTPLGLDEHPLRYLRAREDINPTELAKALCIPQATLTYFERKPRLQKSVPKSFVAALSQNGYKNFEIQEFVQDYLLFRKYVLKVK